MNSSSKTHRDRNFEQVLVLLGVLAGSGAIFFVAGELLTFLATGAFTGAGLLSAIALPLRLLTSLGQPAAAWPIEHRPVMSDGAFWVVSAVMAFAALTALRRVGFRWSRTLGRHAAPDSARWATTKDLARLIVKRPTPGRLTLGTCEGKLLSAENRASLLVMGPTQTNKTTGLVIPAMLEWRGPIVATSVKTDLLDETIAVRRREGEVFVFDPSRSVGGHRTHTWSPLARCVTFEGAQKTAKALVGAAKQAMGGGGDNDVWYKSAQTLLAPYLYAAAIEGHDISKVLDWIDSQERDEVCTILMDVIDGHDDRPIKTIDGIQAYGPEQRSSIYFTAATTIEVYRTPSVLDTARTSEISPAQLLNGGNHTAYLCAPPHEQKDLRAIYATLITEIINYAYDEHVRTGEVLDPPLLLVLDEAANIAPIEQLDELASTAAGIGIQILTVFQDMGQIRARWGHDRAQTIVSNHRAKLVLNGISDEHTLSWVARVTGDQEVRQLSYTSGHQSKSVSDGTGYRSLTPANVLREQETGSGIVIYGNLPPARIKLRPWFAHRGLTQLIQRAKDTDPERRNPTVPPLRVDPITGEVNERRPRRVSELTDEECAELVTGINMDDEPSSDKPEDFEQGDLFAQAELAAAAPARPLRAPKAAGVIRLEDE